MAGLSSTFPAASLAKTVKVLRPLLAFREAGDVQEENAAPLRLHRNVAPASEEVNSKTAFFFLTFFFGFAVIVAAMGCGGAEKAPDDSGGLSTSEQQACVAYAEAFCSRIPECAPAGYDVVGGDQPGCVFQKSRECELVLSAADTGISAQC